MGKLTIDGREVEFRQGQTIIEAATDSGIDIPHFCWHPSLSVSGNCRVCLVEIEKMPKLAIACATVAAEGMVVHTKSDKALSARNAVMEFILINHPLDCPICDEAGECKLQDYAYNHSTGEGRFTEEKQHKDKRVELGPYVMFDAERCISCSRCIRFCDEVAQETELTFVKRGDRVTITTFPGKQLDNPYSLNVTDICPVGALTNRDFRFKSRVWDMSSTQSVCSGCSRGCNIDIWVRKNEILRLTPRHNEQVNSYWMCDHGRLDTFKEVNSESRIIAPMLRRDGTLMQANWSEAVAHITSEFKAFSSDEIGVIGSAHATLEDNYLLAKFAKEILKTKNVAMPSHIKHGTADKILITEDKSPNALGAKLMGITSENFAVIMHAIETGKIKALYVMEEDLVALDHKFETILAKLDFLVVHSVVKNATTALANVVLPAASYAEKNGTWVNINGMAQRIRPAVATQELDRSLDGMSLSRLDKFGTNFDRWGQVNKIDARPSWSFITMLFNSFGHKLKFKMAEEVFHDVAKHVKEFHGLDYDVMGNQGAKISLVAEKV